MKRIIIILVISCLTLHCDPPPKKAEKDQDLRLENLIYTVALSSLKVAYQMDIKRRDNVLKQVRKQLEKEREKSSVALRAFEERVQGLIQENANVSGNTSGVTLQFQESSLSLEDQLVQLETVVFGEEDSKGLLFRVKFLLEKWDLLNTSPPSSTEVPEVSVEVKPFQLQGESSNEEIDNETRLKNLVLFIHGEGDSPGVLFQMEELEKALSNDGLTADQMETLEEKTVVFVQEQSGQVSEEASIEDRIARLENLIYGTEELKGVISQIQHLQTQVVSAPVSAAEAVDSKQE
ncbi:MAG: hypothetical protein OXB86_03460 [Bdellovibrionales bacterium]|nr:hypothetical protein [Bdellovibrionales bacterium]